MPVPPPTRINTLFIDGPVYHWDRITEDQAKSLGVSALPAHHARAIARAGPWTARRLADGRLNVSCTGAPPRTADAVYRGFLSRVLEPAPHSCMQPLRRQPEPSDFAPLQDDRGA
jgi:hypothetical protein